MKWRGASVHRRGRLNTDGSRGFPQMISDVHVYIEVLQSYVKIKHQVPIDSLSTLSRFRPDPIAEAIAHIQTTIS